MRKYMYSIFLAYLGCQQSWFLTRHYSSTATAWKVASMVTLVQFALIFAMVKTDELTSQNWSLAAKWFGRLSMILSVIICLANMSIYL